jgi:Tfp pilus assembly protein PilF
MGLLAALFLLLQAAADPVEEGRKALDANQFERAAELFRQGIAKEPGDYAAHFHLALAYSLQNDDARAIPEYAKTLELKPGLYQAELNLGISLLRTGKAAEAVKPLSDAVAQKPKELQPRVKLGGCGVRRGESHRGAEPFGRCSLALPAGCQAGPQVS